MKEAHHIIARFRRSSSCRRRLQPVLLSILLLVVWAGSGWSEAVHPGSGGPSLRVLGIAQDGGLPHAACHCDRCQKARSEPAAKRLVASLALILPRQEQVYLFDATPDLREQLPMLSDVRPDPGKRVDRDPIAGIFLTHAHIGHYLGLAFLGYEAIHTQKVPVMATPRMADFLRSNGPWSQLVTMNNIVLEEMPPGGTRQLSEGVEVQAIRAPHRDEYADTMGFLIRGPRRTVFYLPDTDSWVAWTSPVTELLAQVDIAVLDGTFFSADELPGRRVEEIGHPLIQDSMDLLQELVDRHGLEVYFTHLNHSNAALDSASGARRAIEERGFHVLEQGHEFPL